MSITRSCQKGTARSPASRPATVSEAGFCQDPQLTEAHEGLRCLADSKSMGKSQHHTHCTGLRSQETYAWAIQVVSGEVTLAAPCKQFTTESYRVREADTLAGNL